MRIPRIYTSETLTAQQTVSLQASAANHIANVLRLKVGAPLVLFNGYDSEGQSGEYMAHISQLAKRRVEVVVDSFQPRMTESPLKIHLQQGLSKGDRMDFAIQKGVELGVNEITPVATERSVVKLDEKRKAKKLEHFRGVSLSASEQSGRCQLTQIHQLLPFNQALNPDAEVKLILDPRAELSLNSLAAQLSAAPEQVALLIGPEGGLSDSEVEQARQQGYQAITLGPRILRTETAALTTISLMQLLWGDLG